MMKRIFFVEVPVNYDLAWADAVRQGAPNTGEGWPIRGLEDQFPTDKRGTITERLRFVQFGPNFYHREALEYGKAEKIESAHPRAIFSSTEHHARIAEEHDEDYMYVSSPLTCSVSGGVHVPDVECYRGGLRYARTHWMGDGFFRRSWFVFREEYAAPADR